jgi:hypothetical protein
MIGPILLALSWLLLRFERTGLGALGFNAPARRAREFAVGFLVAGLVVVAQQGGLALAVGTSWRWNSAVDAARIAHHLRWTLNSVLFEEFVFRGYLLYQAIRWLGPRYAVLLAAAAFGIYHWFSYGSFGNPVVMAYVFLSTGAFGLMLATAFARTKSLALPVGLHLGWDLVAYLGFSAGPLGSGLLIPANGAAQLHATGLANVGLTMVLPLVLVITVVGYLVRRSGRGDALAASPAIASSVA